MREMSKQAVLISIWPVWCGKIFGGFKNLEFRKGKPYFPPPFKCYVYCTQKRERLLEIIKDVICSTLAVISLTYLIMNRTFNTLQRLKLTFKKKLR